MVRYERYNGENTVTWLLSPSYSKRCIAKNRTFWRQNEWNWVIVFFQWIILLSSNRNRCSETALFYESHLLISNSLTNYVISLIIIANGTKWKNLFSRWQRCINRIGFQCVKKLVETPDRQENLRRRTTRDELTQRRPSPNYIQIRSSVTDLRENQ